MQLEHEILQKFTHDETDGEVDESTDVKYTRISESVGIFNYYVNGSVIQLNPPTATQRPAYSTIVNTRQ